MTEFSAQAHGRTRFVIGIIFFMAAALFVRLLDLQLLRHGELLARAQGIVVAKLPLSARRGHIYDQRGRPLALNEKGYVLWVDGKQFQASAEGIALVSSNCTRQSRDTVVALLAGHDPGFYLCSRWVEPAIAEEMLRLVKAGELKGILLAVEPRRSYPYGSLLAPLLGYLQDNGELASTHATPYASRGGVEEFHDEKLRGVDGQIIAERDPENYIIPIGNREEYPPRDGANITLTLDLNLQYMAEQLLIEAIASVRARRGDIVMLDPRTGAIMAMVSVPSFDPNRISECAADPSCAEVLYRNPPIGLHYEPGSTMKILTVAIALQEHVVYPGWSFQCTGLASANGIYFRNWNSGSHGHETLEEILVNSCNVGAVTLNMMIEPETYYRYLDRLSLGRKTGIDLAGEAPGYVPNPEMEGWNLVSQATNAFGQGINMTPIQLASAVATVANGGEAFKPYIVQAIEQNGVVTTTLPTLRSRVFSKEVCREVTDMLVAAAANKGVNGGPLVPGYRIALKTGTAQIPIPGQDYEPHRTIASAIGYGPAEDPRFLILVRIEGNSVIWGETVAVPVLRDLASFTLAYLHIPPTGE